MRRPARSFLPTGPADLPGVPFASLNPRMTVQADHRRSAARQRHRERRQSRAGRSRVSRTAGHGHGLDPLTRWSVIRMPSPAAPAWQRPSLHRAGVGARSADPHCRRSNLGASMSRSAARSSICCWTCSSACISASYSSAMTLAWCAMFCDRVAVMRRGQDRRDRRRAKPSALRPSHPYTKGTDIIGQVPYPDPQTSAHERPARTRYSENSELA